MSDKINLQAMLDFIMYKKCLNKKKQNCKNNESTLTSNYSDNENNYSNNDDILNILSCFLNMMEKKELES